VLPWARAYRIAMTEPNVIIFSMTKNKERNKHFYWLLKLQSLTYRFYSLANRKDLKNNHLSAALNHTVAAVRDSYAATTLKKLGFITGKNLILTLNYKDAWQMLRLGRVDYTFANEQVLADTLTSLNIPAKLFIQSVDYVQHGDIYIALSATTSDKVLKKLIRSLQSMQYDGTLRRLSSTARLPH